MVWVFRLDVAPAVGDAVDVGVHADGWFSVPLSQYEVGCFAAHAFHFDEFFDGVGDFTVVLFDEDLADVEDGLGFCFVESDGVNEFGDGLGVEAEHSFWGVGAGEKASGGLGGAVIFGAQAQNSADKCLEGVALLAGHLGDDWFLEEFIFLAQDGGGLVYRER